jgi:hypothetical protein
MNFDDVLAELKVKEYAKDGIKLSFERARLLVMIETPDFAVRAAMDSPDSLEKAIEVFNLSPRFVEISLAKYGGEKKGVPTGIVAILEQVAEVRDMEKLEPRKEATPQAEEEQALLREREQRYRGATANSWEMFKHLPNAYLYLYPDANHGSIFDYAALFVKQTVEFLDHN